MQWKRIHRKIVIFSMKYGDFCQNHAYENRGSFLTWFWKKEMQELHYFEDDCYWGQIAAKNFD